MAILNFAWVSAHSRIWIEGEPRRTSPFKQLPLYANIVLDALKLGFPLLGIAFRRRNHSRWRVVRRKTLSCVGELGAVLVFDAAARLRPRVARDAAAVLFAFATLFGRRFARDFALRTTRFGHILWTAGAELFAHVKIGVFAFNRLSQNRRSIQVLKKFTFFILKYMK